MLPTAAEFMLAGYPAPQCFARRAYRNLIYFNLVDCGGHFAAWEQELFARELRGCVQVYALIA